MVLYIEGKIPQIVLIDSSLWKLKCDWISINMGKSIFNIGINNLDY